MAEVLVTLRSTAAIGAAGRLAAAGLQVEQDLGELGIVTGTANDEVIAHLRTLDEVEDVSASNPVQLPPPDAPVQ